MKTWPRHPVIYEINTWVWLSELERKHDRLVDLATVPEQEWETIAAHGADAVWFMGVWERSPAGIVISLKNQGFLDDFARALPDFAPEHNHRALLNNCDRIFERLRSFLALGNIPGEGQHT